MSRSEEHSEERDPESPERTVHGVLHVPGEVPQHAARLVVRVLDVGRADAASEVIVEKIITDAHLASETPFEVSVPKNTVGPSYILQVHVDLAGTGTFSPGDYLTTQAYPVLAGGPDEDLEVKLTRI
ncbi:YbaY family lipoprotein [Pseudarthrobacter sp. YS3]|uniref:YbaY family lipoprotein n=1 Tax=Pseudarthrobacter sp. YS3 TaxID=3453718 RepID=UPI003EED1187